MTEIKNNLFGIKWPTGVDMPLNKTQTQTQTLHPFHQLWSCGGPLSLWVVVAVIYFSFAEYLPYRCLPYLFPFFVFVWVAHPLSCLKNNSAALELLVLMVMMLLMLILSLKTIISEGNIHQPGSIKRAWLPVVWGIRDGVRKPWKEACIFCLVQLLLKFQKFLEFLLHLTRSFAFSFCCFWLQSLSYFVSVCLGNFETEVPQAGSSFHLVWL